MRIVIVSTTFSKDEGGASGLAYQQACSLKELGYEVVVFSGTEDADLGWQNIEGIKTYKIKNKNYRYITRSYLCLFNFRVQREFKKFLAEVKPDIVHFHNFYYHLPFYLLKIAKDTGVKVFFTAHDVMTFSQHKLSFFVNKNLDIKDIGRIDYRLPLSSQIKQDKKSFNVFRNYFIRHYLRGCNQIFAVSEELKKALNQNGINNVEVIRNGIDINKWVDGGGDEKIKDKLGLDGKKIILFAARLSGAKGGKVLVEAISKVVKSVPDVVLLVLGKKNNFTNLIEKYILDNDLKNKIIFLGYIPRSKMKEYYYLSDLVVVPSVYLDPFPTVNLEAMACKRPVISTCFGGSREAVVHEKTGFIVNPLDINLFARRIIDLLSDEVKSRNMGLAGFIHVKERFSESEWIRKIVSYYKRK